MYSYCIDEAKNVTISRSTSICHMSIHIQSFIIVCWPASLSCATCPVCPRRMTLLEVDMSCKRVSSSKFQTDLHRCRGACCAAGRDSS